MIELIRGDITTLEVDAIVNAANAALSGGGGVDGAIHRAAGPGLLTECRQHGRCPPGGAVRTAGHGLKARYVIHAVGPVWEGGGSGERETLRRAYESAFARALEVSSIRSVAFPAISTGIYGFPRDEAARISLSVMAAHEPRFERIIACYFDEQSLHIARHALSALRA